MKLGIIVGMLIDELDGELRRLRELGFDTCQLGSWTADLFTDENAETVKSAIGEVSR